MTYYRKMIRAEANNETFNEELPVNDIEDINNEYEQNHIQQNGVSFTENGAYQKYNDEEMNENDVNVDNEGNYIKMENRNEGLIGYKFYWGYVSTWLYSIKNKIERTQIGEKVIDVGGRTMQFIWYAGNKMIEKGINGYNYIKMRFANGNENGRKERMNIFLLMANIMNVMEWKC